MENVEREEMGIRLVNRGNEWVVIDFEECEDVYPTRALAVNRFRRLVDCLSHYESELGNRLDIYA